MQAGVRRSVCCMAAAVASDGRDPGAAAWATEVASSCVVGQPTALSPGLAITCLDGGQLQLVLILIGEASAAVAPAVAAAAVVMRPRG